MSEKKKRKSIYYFSVEEKVNAVKRRIYQEISHEDLLKELHICNTTLNGWMKIYIPEVLRREEKNGIPLYVYQYLKTMNKRSKKPIVPSVDDVLKENARLKIQLEVWEVIARLSKEQCGIDLKKNFEQMESERFKKLTKTSEESME